MQTTEAWLIIPEQLRNLFCFFWTYFVFSWSIEQFEGLFYTVSTDVAHCILYILPSSLL